MRVARTPSSAKVTLGREAIVAGGTMAYGRPPVTRCYPSIMTEEAVRGLIVTRSEALQRLDAAGFLASYGARSGRRLPVDRPAIGVVANQNWALRIAPIRLLLTIRLRLTLRPRCAK